MKMLALIIALGLTAQLQVVSETTILQDQAFSGILSRDGKHLAYVRRGLVIRALDSGQQKQLLPIGQFGWLLAWSPDGKFIYYMHQGDKPWIRDLWRIDVDHGTTARLIRHVGQLIAPAPDGLHIAYRRDSEIMIADVDGKNERALCHPCYAGWFMVWSRDGTQLVVQDNSVRWENALFLLDVQTGRMKQLAHFDRRIEGMDWTTDGAGVLICMTRFDMNGPTETGQIWHVSVPTGETKQLTHDPTGFSGLIGATPDGLALLAIRTHPPPGLWERMIGFFGIDPGPDGIPGTVMLHLKK